MKVTLYTTGCPRCRVLESKLNAAGVEYEKVTDKNLMIEKGFVATPMLDIDGETLSFGDAINRVNNMME